MVNKEVIKSYNLIITHTTKDYDFCTKGNHVHNCVVKIKTNDLDNLHRIRDISNSLASVDYIIEMENNDIQSTIEKFFSFCNDYISIESIDLSFENEYEVHYNIKK